MDANKRVKLQQISYRIQKCCGICKHGQFNPGRAFGVCDVHSYEHLKHTDSTRSLSVYQFGGCPNWEEDEGCSHEMHSFREFM